MSTLEARLNAALQNGDPRVLVTLYQEAAATAGCELQRGFFLTHAYVHALEAGDPRAPGLRSDLVAMGRER